MAYKVIDSKIKTTDHYYDFISIYLYEMLTKLSEEATPEELAIFFDTHFNCQLNSEKIKLLKHLIDDRVNQMKRGFRDHLVSHNYKIQGENA